MELLRIVLSWVQPRQVAGHWLSDAARNCGKPAPGNLPEPDSLTQRKRPDRAYRQSFFSVARLSAVPRMSPSVAPESEEPYWAIASFSSATSSALIETVTL